MAAGQTATSSAAQTAQKKMNNFVAAQCVTRVKLFSILKSLRKQWQTAKSGTSSAKRREKTAYATIALHPKILLKQQNGKRDKIVAAAVGCHGSSPPSPPRRSLCVECRKESSRRLDGINCMRLFYLQFRYVDKIPTRTHGTSMHAI